MGCNSPSWYLLLIPPWPKEIERSSFNTETHAVHLEAACEKNPCPGNKAKWPVAFRLVKTTAPTMNTVATPISRNLLRIIGLGERARLLDKFAMWPVLSSGSRSSADIRLQPCQAAVPRHQPRRPATQGRRPPGASGLRVQRSGFRVFRV